MAGNRKIKRQKKRYTWLWITLMSLFLVELLFYTWCRVQCTQLGYEITQDSIRRSNLVALNNNLNIELESLAAPERIVGYAKNRLAMVVPAPNQVIVVK